MIRLVLFDALHTLLTPRLPIHVQYAQTFEPFLGPLDPQRIKTSFKAALKQVQAERPSYAQGHEEWWKEVIKRTALAAGASSSDVDASLTSIVPRLLARFSSREGYRLFDDALPTLTRLQNAGIRTGLASNCDARMLTVLQDLSLLPLLSPVLISEHERIEKPAPEFFHRACARAGVLPAEALHVGDERACDYDGARHAGLSALLLRRPPVLAGGGDSEYESESGEGNSNARTRTRSTHASDAGDGAALELLREPGEAEAEIEVEVIESLEEVVDYCRRANLTARAPQS